MGIKYELHTIKNTDGKGTCRNYVHLFAAQPLGERVIGQQIQDNCSLTEADLRAALVAIGRLMADELRSGRRFHIPEVGYFSLSAGLDLPAGRTTEQVRANNISVRGIRFRPEAALLGEVRRGTRFEKATFSTKSADYTEESLWDRTAAYLALNKCITRRDMEREFHLRATTARKWLRLFVERGRLRKEGARNSPVYLAAD